MTLIDIETNWELAIDNVPGFSRPVEQYVPKNVDEESVLQLCRMTNQFRISPSAKSGELASCEGQPWKKLDG
jgi:hypothetical protein